MPLCALKPSNLKYLKHSALLMHSPRRPPGCKPVATLAAPAAPSRAFHLAESRQTLVLHDPATENSGNFGGRSPYGFCR